MIVNSRHRIGGGANDFSIYVSGRQNINRNLATERGKSVTLHVLLAKDHDYGKNEPRTLW